MPRFKNGTHVNTGRSSNCKRLRISAGPLRGKYVDVLVLEAKLGRKLLAGMTVEHVNGNSLDCSPDNLIEMTNPDNVRMMHKRRNGTYMVNYEFQN